MIQPRFRHIKVLIADDHPLLREGLQNLLVKYPEIEFQGAAENGEELVRLAEIHQPDIIFTDIAMPVMDGIKAARIISKRFPDTGIIALTMYQDDSSIIDMLEAGAKGYLQKNTNKAELLEAIHTVYDGTNYYCKRTTVQLAGLIAKSQFKPTRNKEEPEFSEKDIEVIRLICKEFSNKQIASELNLSVRTIEGRRDKIQEKMNVTSTAGLVVYAIRKGIYTP
jgi:DNA-binding NarL/FixJ family response regulator